MQRDNLVFDIINKELERQRHGIELIASEKLYITTSNASQWLRNDK